MQDSVAIFWDYENCSVPSNFSSYSIVDKIVRLAQAFGVVKSLKAYLRVSEQVSTDRTLLVRSELQASGVSLIDCPHNVADKMIIVDMLAHAMDNPAPSSILLISGDRDFAYALSILKFRSYRVILVTSPNAHPSLRAQASVRFEWVTDILERMAISPGIDSSQTERERNTFSQEISHHTNISMSEAPSLGQNSSQDRIKDESHNHLPNRLLHPPQGIKDKFSYQFLTLDDLGRYPHPSVRKQDLVSSTEGEYHGSEYRASVHSAQSPLNSTRPASAPSLSTPPPAFSVGQTVSSSGGQHNHYSPALIPHREISAGESSNDSPIPASVPEDFMILVQSLRNYILRGIHRPLRSKISIEISQNGATYRKAGLKSFAQYAALAEQLKLVELGGTDGGAWISLKQSYHK